MKLSIEKFKKYVDDEFSLEQLEALSDVIEDRLIMLKTAIDKANHKTIKGFSINEQADAEAFIYEILYLVAFARIFAKVFSPTPLVGFEIDLSNAGLSELLKIIFK